ncbi:ImmA/IrrE family metallo-endopeptidase [Psychrobacillus sp.]|uniref:ImmA/IrrE family metallo-endopeptidase n=1 Tax=Psychrobacillus sp. TaxID=1871623 RepID=UPI0028BE70F6|nr:ImmA/IrrE family metallo-endopeptidase [Psychrobacillus sp.]
MNNTYSLLEDFIKNLYQRIGIYHPHQLDIETIAASLGIPLNYYDGISTFTFKQLFLNNRLTDEALWQDFGHEMCHALWHCGNQRFLPPSFVQLQEWKANNFMYEFCVPEFMLREYMNDRDIHPINLIIENFHVTPEFARIRYERYMMKLYQQQSDDRLNALFK